MAKKPIKKKRVIKLQAKAKMSTPSKPATKSPRKYATTAPAKPAAKKTTAKGKKTAPPRKVFMPHVRAKISEEVLVKSSRKDKSSKASKKPTKRADQKPKGSARVLPAPKIGEKIRNKAASGAKSSKPSSMSVSGKKKPKKAITEKNKSQKYEDKEFKALYQRVWRKRHAVDQLTKEKKRGYKSKRTVEYKALIELNKEMEALCKKKGYSLPDDLSARRREIKKKRQQGPVTDTVEKTRRYTAKVWEFEATLALFIDTKRFNRIYIVNIGAMYYIKKHRPSTIIAGFDAARNDAYTNPFAGTPFVDVTENYAESLLTLEVVS